MSGEVSDEVSDEVDGSSVEARSEVVEAAAELLSRRYGGQPHLTGVEELVGSGNAVVLRARVAPTAFFPHRSVVIKHNPATGLAIDDAALLREVVAYQFATALPEAVRPGPILFAHDIDRRILVLSDAGDGDTLADALLRTAEGERVELLRSLGSALGAMHAGTAGREEDYEALLSRQIRLYPECADGHELRDDSLRGSIELGLELLAQAGMSAPEAVRELAATASASLSSGHHRAFTPYDLSPDNVIVGHTLAFLDYEWAGFRNVGFDVACVIAGFPQFVFARPITDEEAEVFIAAWQRCVVDVWPRFADAAVVHELVVSCLVGWALSSVTTMVANGIEGVAGLSRGDVDHAHDPRHLLRRGGESATFSEGETLIRRDLYETFEALARYARADTDVARFADDVAQRLRES